MRPALLDEFRACLIEWFSWDKWSEQEPGLFKLEFEGTCRIALCSKCCFMENDNGRENVSSEGISKRQTKNPHWEQYKDLVEGGVDTATNRGMRMNGGVISTYEQKCWGWARAVTHVRCLKTGSTWSCLNITSWKTHGRWSCGRCYDPGGSLVSAGMTKFFANKATLGPIMQIVQNHFIGFGNVFFRCDTLSKTRSGLSGAFPSAFKLAELVEIVHNHRWGEPFFAQFKGSVVGSRRLGINGLFFYLFSRLLASQPSNLTIQSRSETAAGSRMTHF